MHSFIVYSFSELSSKYKCKVGKDLLNLVIKRQFKSGQVISFLITKFIFTKFSFFSWLFIVIVALFNNKFVFSEFSFFSWLFPIVELFNILL